MIKPIIVVGLISFTGAWAFAQAPIVDLNDPKQTNQAQNAAAQNTKVQNTPPVITNPTDVATRLLILERKDQSRVEAQQRVQQQLDMLQGDVDTIRGSIELHNHQLGQILERQRELYLELQNRFSDLSEQTASAGNSVGVIAPSAQGNRPAGQSEEQAYQSAVNLILKERNYDDAIPAFQVFLSTFPNSSYTDNAHYWLGQLLFNKQDWDGARLQFESVVNKFADSPKRADAILKLGMVEKSVGNKAKAKRLFEQVVAEYPDATPSRLANEQLKSL
ncbi:tol-pal system protein YbgF [Glaciecola sp. 33A]|uniref:tol-pal system protein YbgF n=1 Tax=Glaciecola sp. 33A TaxID=2057807 RepID=UPI000C3346C8|nr:tol-pal system protein YbgF [Glaciecola sp. 33A]PKI01907.1 tol-pal system protein YbgF [Glaciecola sp. 33A]